MANTESLTQMIEISRALWADPKTAENTLSDTLAVVALLPLEGEDLVNRMATALIERFEREGAAVNADALQQNFFKLHPLQRVILIAHERLHWDYERIEGVFDLSRDELETLFWKSRIDLLTHRAGRPILSLPSPSNVTANCPEFNPIRPWSSRYLDHAVSRADQVFLQGHIEHCPSCKGILDKTRTIHFESQAELLPELAPEVQARSMTVLRDLLKISEKYALGSTPDFWTSIRLFVRKRRDIQVLIFMALAWCVWKIVS